jgi:hypothetical protein
MPYQYGGSYSGGGGAPGYVSSGGAGDSSGFMRNLSYSGGMNTTGAIPKLAPLNTMGTGTTPVSGNFGVGGAPMTYDQSFGPYNMRNSMDWAYGGQQNVEESLKERAMALAAKYKQDELDKQMQFQAWQNQQQFGNELSRDRYGDYRRYGR